ncbi:putative invertase [Nocardia farcinica IFM 10152]|uniref:Putative invertase n=1 Tax=Nocardia farcinica (strain IFM 10152) TaxID=247156 RepID=Q5YR93_NOCFA|nr:putative invertase [Nocardia farcinica IFM 10152]
MLGLTQRLRGLIDNTRYTSTVTVTDALDDRMGFRAAVRDLGAHPELIGTARFAQLRSSIQTMQNAAAHGARLRDAVIATGNEIRRIDARRLVWEMSVDRLREATADKLTIGPLTDVGITTVLQVMDRGHELEYLPRIGRTTATRIRGAAQTLWQTTFDETPTGIDINNRDPRTTELLRRLRAWDSHRRAAGELRDSQHADLAPLASAVHRSGTDVMLFPVGGRSTSEYHLPTRMAHGQEMLRRRVRSNYRTPWVEKGDGSRRERPVRRAARLPRRPLLTEPPRHGGPAGRPGRSRRRLPLGHRTLRHIHPHGPHAGPDARHVRPVRTRHHHRPCHRRNGTRGCDR